MVVGTLKISLDRLKKREESAVVSVAVSSAYCLLVKASLCLEAAERPQWPRLYLLSGSGGFRGGKGGANAPPFGG